jgi:uncharacterized repeat protein (TIGR01451 family)
VSSSLWRLVVVGVLFVVPFVASPAANAQEEADLWVTRFEGSGPPEYNYRAFNGQSVYYIVEVTNRGPATATGVTLTQNLPAELEYDASRSDERCAAAGTNVTCALGTVAPWESVSVLVFTTARASGTFTSSVSVSGDQPEALPHDNSATTSVLVNPSADVAVDVADSPDPVRSQDPVTYTVEVTNNGPDVATSGRLNVNWQPLGPVATLIGFSSTSDLACFQSFFNHIDCDFGTLGVGETATLTVELSYKGKGSVEFRAAVLQTAQFDPVANQEAVETTTVVRGRVR